MRGREQSCGEGDGWRCDEKNGLRIEKEGPEEDAALRYCRRQGRYPVASDKCAMSFSVLQRKCQERRGKVIMKGNADLHIQ